MSSLDDVLSTVHERVTPTADERRRLSATADRLIARAEKAIDDRDLAADVLQVGSTARGTWLAGDRDIDLFVRFPPDLPREDLETHGLAIGHDVLPEGHQEYAEHPYVKGEVDGFDVDCVPCYRVDSATDIRSAVDRTPFHTQYLDARIDDELAGDVRVFKRFLKGIGAYGSDLKTRGFSGYLAELLVVEYGGLKPLLEAAADWSTPVEFDPEDHGTTTFDDPLVVIDPTDPDRNVAAVCAAENVARLQHYARELLADPDLALFFPPDREPLSVDAVRERLADRATTPLAIGFETPDIVDDQLYPQLDKSLAGIESGLENHGFEVFRSARLVGDDGGTALLLVELSTAELPAVERHEGPPVSVREHATGFYETYVDDESCVGPFLDGDRYVVERPREWTDAAAYLDSDAIFEVGLGVHVESALEDGYDLLVGSEAVAELVDTLGACLTDYLDPRP
ncbi:CCA tRNA nucleotidyltransferase [Halohasta salina]|uniref:CCA tRNA nucleotidyltransferase n=1 Tax=Halohasta salina TaxID=2961621 RepID=UPI0020A27936|nr:CCA tRNA nucleotidyltransferase [Halohasta salina]